MKKYNFSKFQSPNIIKIYASNGRKEKKINIFNEIKMDRNRVFLTNIFTHWFQNQIIVFK